MLVQDHADWLWASRDWFSTLDTFREQPCMLTTSLRSLQMHSVFILTPPGFSKSHFTECASKTIPLPLSLLAGLLERTSTWNPQAIPASHYPATPLLKGGSLPVLASRESNAPVPKGAVGAVLCPGGPAAPLYCGGPAAPSFPVFPSPAAEAASIAAGGGREAAGGRRRWFLFLPGMDGGLTVGSILQSQSPEGWDS